MRQRRELQPDPVTLNAFQGPLCVWPCGLMRKTNRAAGLADDAMGCAEKWNLKQVQGDGVWGLRTCHRNSKRSGMRRIYCTATKDTVKVLNVRQAQRDPGQHFRAERWGG